MASSCCSNSAAKNQDNLLDKPNKSTYFNPLDRTTPSLPLCLYYTQGYCTNMDDPTHLKAFDHSFLELKTEGFDLKLVQPQLFDYFLVLDLEGKKEILEFPVVMIDAKTTKLVDFFHRFVRPTGMSKQENDEIVDNKYGKFGISGVWHETAIPFEQVIREFEDWMVKYKLWNKESGGPLNKAAFVICGNWDIKTQVPHQCNIAGMELPSYFREWINLKDIYLNFYNWTARGMLAMMWPLKITVAGIHHVGIDDATNIARVLQRMIIDGAVLQISARRRNPDEKCEFLFQNRIKW